MTTMEKEKKLLPQISLTKLIRQLWSKKWPILLIAFISGVIGFVIGLDLPKKYRTVVTLAPESSDSDLASAASSIGSMLGMSLSASGSDAIYPELYPDIINTIPFTVEMLNIPVCTVDSTYTGNLYNYLVYHQKKTLIGKARKKLYDKLHKKDVNTSDELDPYRLSKRQMTVIETFHEMVTCDVDVKTFVITLTSVMQDKQVACTVADTLCVKLQEYVTAYKTNKASNDLKNVRKLYEESKQEYIAAQQQYAAFMDRNMNLTRESAKAEAVRLENEQNITFSVYQEMSSQLAVARAKLQEQTPAFAVLEPARLAEWHFTPKKSVIAIIFAFIGGIAACVWYFLKLNDISVKEWFSREDDQL